MIVIYGSFEVGHEDREGFDQWFSALVEVARREEGCIAYDYLKEYGRFDRGTIFEIWETAEALGSHMVHPGHVEMLAIGAEKWLMRNVQVHYWNEAESHESRPRSDQMSPLKAGEHCTSLLRNANVVTLERSRRN